MKNKKGAEMGHVIVYLLVALVVLIVVAAGIIILAKKDFSFMDFIKNLFVFKK